MITAITIWLIFIATQVVWNWYIIVRKKRSPDHTLHFALRGVCGAVLAVLASTSFIQWNAYMFFFAMSFWFLFDAGLNKARGLDLMYIGETSWLDKKFHGKELPFFFLKFWLVLLAIRLLTLPNL